MLAKDVAEKQDYPWYQSPFISNSPNHYALWAKTVYLGGKVFRNSQWEQLGARVMHRFATDEQTLDGYWGEWTGSGPTTEPPELQKLCSMHLDDSPLSPLRGLPRIMRSLEKLLDLVLSPVNGITFCQGNFALMTQDVPAAIRLYLRPRLVLSLIGALRSRSLCSRFQSDRGLSLFE